MYSQEPHWLLPEDIVNKYRNYCFYNNITERRIVKLFDASLLIGRPNRTSKKVEILEESFEYIQKHIEYSFLKRTGNLKLNAHFTIPQYLKVKYELPYDNGLTWYTPTEVRKTYEFIFKKEEALTIQLLGDLVQMGLVIGKYDPKENCYYMLLTSFVEILKLHEYCVSEKLLFPRSGLT